MGARPLGSSFRGELPSFLPSTPNFLQKLPARDPLLVRARTVDAQTGVRARFYHGRVGGRFSRCWWESRPVLQGLPPPSHGWPSSMEIDAPLFLGDRYPARFLPPFLQSLELGTPIS
jgi:hypothetical protein